MHALEGGCKGIWLSKEGEQTHLYLAFVGGEKKWQMYKLGSSNKFVHLHWGSICRSLKWWVKVWIVLAFFRSPLLGEFINLGSSIYPQKKWLTKFETLQTRAPAADIELSDSQLFLDYNAHVAMTKTITKSNDKGNDTDTDKGNDRYHELSWTLPRWIKFGLYTYVWSH